jgi:hypothetical protein
MTESQCSALGQFEGVGGEVSCARQPWLKASPNTRVQRTRLRSPLTRRPLGRGGDLASAGVLRIALVLALPVAVVACAGGNSVRVESSATVESQVLGRDQAYAQAWLKGDWESVAAIVAPEYWGVGDDFSWDFAKLKEEFPKAKAIAYTSEKPQVRQLAPGLALLNRVTSMRETYAGTDISGRYWVSEIWTLRDGRWLLLVEQEVLLQPGATAGP